MNQRRRVLTALGTSAVAPWTAAIAGGKGDTPSSAWPIEGKFPSLAGATAWLNSPALSATGLRGKVVVIDFWTYSCINWLRSLPYIRAWANKYRSRGLVTIGVHTPEFAFEKELEHVRRAAQSMNVNYPIALDSDYAIWDAFHNEYWPALYFIDARGNVRHHQFGEGSYEQSERVIQRLLSEAGVAGVGSDMVSVDARGLEAAADWSNLKSPENYVGYGRTKNFSSAGGVVRDSHHIYAVPARMEFDAWALAGDWTIGKNAIALNGAGGRIACRFRARDLHLAMGPPHRESGVRFRVRIDGQQPDADRGVDVDGQGFGIATEPRLHQLIRQVKPGADRLFEIEFLDAGVEAWSFTFG